MKLSIVATLYKSGPYITEFHQRASAAAKQLVGEDYEIVLVNDGSPDNSLELAIAITEQDKHLLLIDLSRNFGHHKAIMTGLEKSSGELVFLIDADLEEDPELLISFEKQMKAEECDVVFGVQGQRKGGLFERVSGFWFYRLFNAIAGLDIPENIITARLMTRSYVNALLLHKEREIFLAGLWSITGFEQHIQVVSKWSTSPSTYTFKRKMSLFVNSITSFSNAPLIYIFYLGIFISMFALSYIVYLFSHWFLMGKALSGWTSIIASLWLLGGLIISFIGVIGIYLSKIFIETKQRPYTIVRRVYGKKH
jgi:putative glycosyltransferase